MFNHNRERGFRKPFSFTVIISLVFSTLFITAPLNTYDVRADFVYHTVGNLDLMVLTDWGSLGYPLKYNDVEQIAQWNPYLGHAIAGLVFDQANYNHGGTYGIADVFDSGVGERYYDESDFKVTSEDVHIHFEIDDDTIQKSYASFTQVDESVEPIGVAYDVRIHQTAWTLADKDWAIIEWTVQNIWGSDLTDVNLGFMCWITGNATEWQSENGVGGDEGDDIDYWDSSDDIYYVRDDNGTGDILGFSSADASVPFNHYYSHDFHYFGDEFLLYSALTGANRLLGEPGGREIYSLLSWNGYTIQASTNMTFAMVIAYSEDISSMKKAVKEAQDFYYKETAGVLITEIQDSSSPAQRIEVYNKGRVAKDLSNWELRNRNGDSLIGNWIPDSNLLPQGHRYLDITSGLLDPEGDIIYLYDNVSNCVDKVAYGQFGFVPDPINGESASRVWESGQQRYIDDWTMTLSGITVTSFGSQNNVPAVDKNPLIVLNEVLFYNNIWEKFIELWFIGENTLELTNFKIVGDSVYNIPGPLSVSNYVPVYFVTEATDPTLFSTLTPDGDNIYLYTDCGVLLDMVGWNSTHNIDTSIKRIPDGNGTYDGYDDISSENAGWQFSQAPTPPSILLEFDQKKAGNTNSDVTFNLTITNFKNDNDVIDILLESSQPNNWPVSFFTGDGTWRQLIDTNDDPNGYVDIGILKPSGLTQYESVNIFVNISIPSSPLTNYEFTAVSAQSSTNPAQGYDTAFLTTEIAPYININKTANPKTIYIEGTGYPEESQITLNLTGMGIPQPTDQPQDTVFVIDGSYSMFTNDPLGYRILGTKQYIDRMKDHDRAAIVGFGHDVDYMFAYGAWLTQDMADNPLGYPREPHHFRNTDENNKTSIKSDVDSLNWYSSSTNIELALQIALQEMVMGYIPTEAYIPSQRPFPSDKPGDADGVQYGNSSHLWVIILLTDGIPSHPFNCTDDEVAIAIANNIEIFTIGLGSEVDEDYLNHSIAQPTGGEYMFAAQAEDILIAYEKIRTLIISKVAGSAVPPPPPQPMVTDIIPGVFNVNISSIYPTPIFVGDDGLGNTKIQWDIQTINVSESWIATYNISSDTRLINQNVTFHPFATVDYFSWDNRIVSAPIPSDYISCVAPLSQPTLYINISDDGKDVILYWDPPLLPGIDYYLLYRSTSQTNFNFSDIWVNTSCDMEKDESDPIPLRTMWNDTNSADPDNKTNYKEQYYYTIRAANSHAEMSSTSRTVGKWTRTFQGGVSSFSLPLEPQEIIWTKEYTEVMNAEYIRYMDSQSHTWNQHNKGDGNLNNTPMRLGEAYEVRFDNITTHTFVGLPGAMIHYDDDNGFLGFDAFSEAKNLTVIIETNGDVNLTWDEPACMGIGDTYTVYYSNKRDGFFGNPDRDFFMLGSVNYGNNNFTHKNAQAYNPGARLYYMVVPYNSSGVKGSSTYSIGIWTEEYSCGYDTIGLPMKQNRNHTADWYCDNIPDTVGINYFKNSRQRWYWHSTIMPKGAFDTLLVMTEGYQISTSSTTKYTFIGI
ncbi:MAG: VWA domain-containing protein [Thermoplasmata archaeon]|nr:MAG: VWA domain-containing protein [Thermoplasmata archaeon]